MHLQTAEEAYRKAAGNQEVPIGWSENFVCPHCSAFSQQSWGTVGIVAIYPTVSSSSSRQIANAVNVVLAKCAACEAENLFVDGVLLFPRAVDAPSPTVDMPEEVKADFEEARLIYALSPRGTAALLRLVIQKLCPLLGAVEPDINKAIGELVSKGAIPPVLQQALDSVRVIGNEAVHPGTMDLKDDRTTARSLFDLVNFIIEKAITEPKQIAKIYGELPANKLAGIAQRDANNAAKKP